MLKLFGAGLTMFSCFAAGCLICAEMKKRIHILEELRRMTVMLSAEIGYANTMLDEAFGSIAKRVSPPLSDFLVHVQEKMQKGEEANLGVIFEKQLEMDLKGTALKESDLASLRTLGGQLGYLDVAMQKKTLDYYLEQVSDACVQAKKEYREKEKMFRCLGFGAGAFLVILLYWQREEMEMSVNLLFKIAAVGILVSVLGQVLKHSGREEQAYLASLAGLVLVLFWVLPYISQLFESIKELFAL